MNTFDIQLELFKFSGSVDAVEKPRLDNQLKSIKDLMIDGRWRTLRNIECIFDFKYGQSSISANLRNLRKEPFGLVLEKRRVNNHKSGLWEYRISEGK